MSKRLMIEMEAQRRYEIIASLPEEPEVLFASVSLLPRIFPALRLISFIASGTATFVVLVRYFHYVGCRSMRYYNS